MVVLVLVAHAPPVALVDVGAAKGALDEALQEGGQGHGDKDIPHAVLGDDLVLFAHERRLLLAGQGDGRADAVGVVAAGDLLVEANVLGHVGGPAHLVDAVGEEGSPAVDEAGDVDGDLLIGQGTWVHFVSKTPLLCRLVLRVSVVAGADGRGENALRGFSIRTRSSTLHRPRDIAG